MVSKDRIIFSIGQIVTKLIMFVFYIILPKLIGLHNYGYFIYILTLCIITIQPIADFGLDLIIVKRVSRSEYNIIKKSLLIKSVGSVISVVIVLFIAKYLKLNLLITTLLSIYIILLSFSNIFLSYFRGKQYFIYEAIFLPASKIIAFISIFILYVLSIKNYLNPTLALLASAIFLFFITIIVFKKNFKNHTNDYVRLKEVILEGATLFFTSILWIIYFRVDTLMLGIMVNSNIVGLYDIAYKIMSGTFIVPGIVMAIVFPKLGQKNAAFNKLFLKTFLIMCFLGILSGLILYGMAYPFIYYIYGKNFISSVHILKILSFVVPVVFIGHLTTQSIVALDKSKFYLWITSLGTILNIILNYFLIKQLQAVGAAYATLITEIFIAIVTLLFVIKNIKLWSNKNIIREEI